VRALVADIIIKLARNIIFAAVVVSLVTVKCRSCNIGYPPNHLYPQPRSVSDGYPFFTGLQKRTRRLHSSRIMRVLAHFTVEKGCTVRHFRTFSRFRINTSIPMRHHTIFSMSIKTKFHLWSECLKKYRISVPVICTVWLFTKYTGMKLKPLTFTRFVRFKWVSWNISQRNHFHRPCAYI